MAGFTLLELLVVLVVLGLLAAVVTPQVMNLFSGAKTDTARLQAESLATAVSYFHIDTGVYPSTEEGLQALWTRPPQARNWRGPYVRKAEHLRDPWGQVWRYRVPGAAAPYDIYSLGADGREGGEGENADIGYSPR